MRRFRLVKAITLAALGASLTAAAVGLYPIVSYGTVILLIGFLLFLLATNKKSIINYYAELEADSSIPLPSDSKIWGVKPKYREMAPYVVPMTLFFSFYAFSGAIDAANGSEPWRKLMLIYDLFGPSGIVFVWFTIGLILIVASTELTYYLWKTRKNA
jgi:hypothetical protein